MFHTLAYGGAVIASAANQNVAASIDNVITTSANNKYIMPAKVQVLGASALNDFLTRARINAPSLRNEGLPEIYPGITGSVNPNPPVMAYWRDVGPTLQMNEEVGLEITDGVSVTLNATGAIWIQDKRDPIPPGKRMRIFGSAALTLVKNAWVSGNIVLDQTLPFGNYAVIGMQANCPNSHVARLIFPRSGVWRPGCLTGNAVGATDPLQYFGAGVLGMWGQFTSVAQPLVEVFAVAAGAQTVNCILDMVQLAA